MVARLKRGDELNIVGESADKKWFEVEGAAIQPGGRGWMHRDILRDAASTVLGTEKAEIDRWLGTYTHATNCPGLMADSPNRSRIATLTITRKGEGDVRAEVEADGFQTMTRVECDVVAATGGGIELRFRRELPENMGSYKPQERLLTLRDGEGGAETVWGAMDAFCDPDAKVSRGERGFQRGKGR